MLPPVTQVKAEPSSVKPKPGRLISNQKPLEDFTKLIEGEGDIFRKAMRDLGAVIKENVESSFSRQAFPLAIDCLKEMRKTALIYEEVETYNECVSIIVKDRKLRHSYLAELETYMKEPGFKHKDFWSRESLRKFKYCY